MSPSRTTRSLARVLVVDDSAFMRLELSRMIASESGFEVVGTACSGFEALEKIPLLNPDLITLDPKMPGLDGLETLRHVMLHFPRPVIIVSGSGERNSEVAAHALRLGAFGYVAKQLSSSTLDIFQIREELLAKLQAAAEMRPSHAAGTVEEKPSAWISPKAEQLSAAPAEIVAIGASTGGPRALQQILPILPTDLPVPVLVVQHMPAGFSKRFAENLNAMSAVRVREAVHRDFLHPGVIYVAPTGTHMTVQRFSDLQTSLWLDSEPSDRMHTPSIDVMMESVAEAFGDRAMGIILSGMGSDGVEGIKAIHRKGGLTIGQDEASCVVASMPRACAALDLLSCVLPLAKIPARIVDATQPRKRA
jgi:two-component system, chemotaxis family, protein-glutamate methylesterase/glutaminase